MIDKLAEAVDYACDLMRDGMDPKKAIHNASREFDCSMNEIAVLAADRSAKSKGKSKKDAQEATFIQVQGTPWPLCNEGDEGDLVILETATFGHYSKTAYHVACDVIRATEYTYILQIFAFGGFFRVVKSKVANDPKTGSALIERDYADHWMTETEADQLAREFDVMSPMFFKHMIKLEDNKGMHSVIAEEAKHTKKNIVPSVYGEPEPDTSKAWWL